jgi:TPR repeat protein
VVAAAHLVGGPACAGPLEDGMAAYNRGDYLPAMQILRPLARAGNARAQAALGLMYHRGQGVAKSPAHAFAWLSLAARRGEPGVKAELKTVSAVMKPDELSRAQQIIEACEASDYRSCEH